MRDPGVDNEDAVLAEDHADVLVVEGVPSNEDPIADLGPQRHPGSVPARVPTMSTMTTSTTLSVPARDGTPILVRRWRVDPDPWASVLLVHGVAEHSGRYEHVGGQLAAAGIEVEGFDLRGFGGSGGRRAFVERWRIEHDDLEDRLTAIRAAAGTRPVALYGHWLGGLIALGYAVAQPARPLPDALVLSAPALDSRIRGWKRAMARVLGAVAPN